MNGESYLLVDTKEARSLLLSKLFTVDIPSLALAMVIALIITDIETLTNFSMAFVCIVIFGAYLTFILVSILDKFSNIITLIQKLSSVKNTILSDVFVNEEKIKMVNHNLISMLHIESLFYVIIYYSAYRGQSEEFKKKQMKKNEYEIDITSVDEIDLHFNLLFYDIVKLSNNEENYYLLLKDGEDFINTVTLLQI